ncbi:MAG: hypothetical protein WAS54_09375 [Scrofimicrobium sp.]
MSEANEPAQLDESATAAPTGGRKSGFEVADNAMNAAGKAASVAGRGMLIVYGIVLIIIGLFGIFALDGFAAKAGAFLFIGYGVYLLFGGSWVIY